MTLQYQAGITSPTTEEESACAVRPIETTGWGERRNVEMVLQLDTWLRQYRVRLAL